MLTELIIARLQAKVPALLFVGSAADVPSGATGMRNQVPCAYVYNMSESGTDSRYLTGMVAQKRQQRVAVALVVKNVRDMQGAAASQDMDALRVQTDAALFGWTPDAVYAPLIFVSGRFLGFKDGQLWWQDEYTTHFDRRA